MPDGAIKRVEQLGKKDSKPTLLINGDDQEDIEDNLSYDAMSYESGDSVPLLKM